MVCVAACIALAVAMGVGRFAFTPLLPLMARDGVLAGNAGAWLAASNYLGYFLGAMVAGRLSFSNLALLRGGLVGIVVFTAAMGIDGPLAWWALLRFLAGVFSAWVLVATSSWALGRLAQAGRPDLAGVVYAGVGLGIAGAGVYCLVAAHVPAAWLWIQLGALAALVCVIPLAITQGAAPVQAAAAPAADATQASSGAPPGILVVCYGLFGFGYILPATFLPALARQLVDDPQVFGWAWPLFGLAAALSTLASAWCLKRVDRRRVWAVSHMLMAAGALLPSIRLSLLSVALAALLVGGSFMVATMAGMQEGRERAGAHATAFLARMTAAFALGQFAGPLVSAALAWLPAGHAAALDIALQLAALGLALSAAWLWRASRPGLHYR